MEVLPCPYQCFAESVLPIVSILIAGVFHCGVHLQFLDDHWCWTPSHVLSCHLYIFLGEISLCLFCPFLNWVGCFLIHEFCGFFLCSEYKSYKGYMFCKYFPPVCGLSFQSTGILKFERSVIYQFVLLWIVSSVVISKKSLPCPRS